MPQRSTAYPERRGRRVGEEPVAGRWNLALQLELVSMLIIWTLSGVGVARSRSLPPTAGRVARLWLYAHRGRRRRWRRRGVSLVTRRFGILQPFVGRR